MGELPSLPPAILQHIWVIFSCCLHIYSVHLPFFRIHFSLFSSHIYTNYHLSKSCIICIVLLKAEGLAQMPFSYRQEQFSWIIKINHIILQCRKISKIQLKYLMIHVDLLSFCICRNNALFKEWHV